MKNIKQVLNKIFGLLFVTICFATLLKSNEIKAQQFTNYGFESWNFMATMPSNRNTLSAMGLNACDISRSSVCHGGNYAIDIKPKQMSQVIATYLNVKPMPIPGVLTNAIIDLNGLMSLVTADSLNINDIRSLGNVFTNGLPITKCPTRISGYYDFEPLSSSDHYILSAIAIRQENDTTRLVVAAGMYQEDTNITRVILPGSSPFKQFDIDMYQIIDAKPTELIFVAAILNTDTVTTNFGSLKIDDISVSYTSGLNTINKEKNNFVVYPNPSKDGDFMIKTNENIEVDIFNILGQNVKHINSYSSEDKISLNENGLYFLKIKDKYRTRTQKLIIR